MDHREKQDGKIEEGFVGQKMIVLSPDRLVGLQQNQLSAQLYPTAIGYYPNASSHYRERKTGCEQYILLYCLSGRGWVKEGKKEYTLSANTFYILEKNLAHSYGSSTKDPWSIYWVHFTGESASLLYQRFLSMSDFPSTVPYDPGNINTFDQIFGLSENDLGPRESELLYVRLLHFISAFVYTSAGSVLEESDRITDSISYMRNNLEKNLSIRDLAALANYSISRYSELFRERTGYSPIQYFLQVKIQKSCQYLYFTKLPIKEICKEIGFDDQYYFSRMFKKQMNVSPLQYRKAHQL